MASVGGRLASVRYGGSLIAGMGEWTMTGFIPEIQEDVAFGDTVKKYKQAGIGDAGEVSFSGQYDSTDGGQAAIEGLKNTDSEITTLYFYESTSVFWRVSGPSGRLIMSKWEGPKFGKNMLATIAFAAKVSAQPMEKVTVS
jgi:hypothetical protein